MNRLRALHLRAEEGVTLVELLVATVMMVIIVGAAISLLVTAMRQQPTNSKRSQQIGETRNAIEKMTKDIRQASKAVPAGKTGVTLTTYCGATTGAESCTVKYACAVEAGVTPTSYACTKQVGTAAAAPFLSKLINAEVFCYMASTETGKCAETNGTEPKFVGVKVEIRAPGEKFATVLEDGAALHNSITYRGS